MNAQTVILIHGLWMTGLEMVLLRWRLWRAGFRTCTFRYPTLRATVAENAGALAAFIQRRHLERPHLVCHSLGGLVALRFMADHPEQPLGRMVALGSPFLGNFTSHYLATRKGWTWLFGRSLEQGLDGRGVRQTPPAREIGVIAGTISFGPAKMLRDLARPRQHPSLPPNDGPVMVSETQLPGIQDHLTLPICHIGLVLSSHIARQTVHFLQQGRFFRENTP